MTLASPYDPPVFRHTWVTGAAQDRAAFLADLRARLALAGLATDRIESALWHGGVHVGGRPYLESALPPSVPERSAVTVYAFEIEPAPPPLRDDAVLLDAHGVVAVDKPAWMTVQASRASLRLSLESLLRARLQRPGLVAAHRLDRGTSGVVLFAEDPATAAHLGRELASGRAHRRYLAVVSPRPDRPSWQVEGFIGRVLHPTRFRFGLHEDPGPGRKTSRTRFARLATRGDDTLVLAEPATGRTHQLRVHLAYGGTPIVGDTLYGGRADLDGDGAPIRTQLHAAWLRVRVDPAPGARALLLAAPAPPDFAVRFASAGREKR